MKIEKDTFNLNYKKEQILSYNYMEELLIVLESKELKLGKNNMKGVEFVLTDNGGEISLFVPNFPNIHHTIPFDMNKDDENWYLYFAGMHVKVLLEKIDKIRAHIKSFEL